MTSPTTAPATGALDPKSRKIIITLLVAAFVVILNETIMGVALPRLMEELQVTESVVQWLSTAFMLTMAVVIPTTGFLLQRLATRTVFILALSLFSAGTLLAAISAGFWMLLGARVIQASGTAMMVPLMMTTILTLVPPARRGAVMGNVSIAISVAPAIGPTLSGLILQYLSWRFMFILVLPVALAALVYGARRLEDVGEREHHALDLLSVVLSVPAFGGVVFGLSRIGGAATSGLAPIVIPLALGLVSLVLFGLRQHALQRTGNPLLDLRVFSYPMFRLAIALLMIAMIALFGMVILLPIYLQNIRGLSSLGTGLLLLPGGLLMGLLAPFVGRLFDRYGPKVLTITGASLLSLTMWAFSTIDSDTPVWLLIGVHLVLSVGLACLFTPAFTTGLNPLPQHLYSHGSAMLATLQQVAGAAGTALLVTIMAGRSVSLIQKGVPELAAQNAGIQTAFGTAAIIGIGAIIVAAFLRRTTAGAEEPESPAVPAILDPEPAGDGTSLR